MGRYDVFHNLFILILKFLYSSVKNNLWASHLGIYFICLYLLFLFLFSFLEKSAYSQSQFLIQVSHLSLRLGKHWIQERQKYEFNLRMFLVIYSNVWHQTFRIPCDLSSKFCLVQLYVVSSFLCLTGVQKGMSWSDIIFLPRILKYEMEVGLGMGQSSFLFLTHERK